MAEQVRVDEVVTNIMYGLAQVIAEEAKTEQERAKAVAAVSCTNNSIKNNILRIVLPQ